MKFLPFISLFSLAAIATAETQRDSRPRFRDAATHEQLSLKLKKAEQIDPMKKLTAVKGPDPSKVNQPVNLLEQSDIICFRGMATLVPKRAILATPDKHRDCLKLDPEAKIVGWQDFYAANRAWITTVEVSRVQAEGNEDIAEKTRERIGKSVNLVVATYMTGPISVLPLKEATEVEETSKTASNTP